MACFNKAFNSENGKGPCMHCADRRVGCHGVCKDYNDWRNELRAKKEQLKKIMPPKIYNSDFGEPINKGRDIR